MLSSMCKRSGRIDMEKIRINNEYIDESVPNLLEDESEELKLSVYLSNVFKENEICFDDNIEKFNQIIRNNTSKFFFFVGFQNTGKTAFLKKYFGICGNTSFFNAEHRRLVLPILGGGEAEDNTPYEKATRAIRGLCDRIEFEYPQAEQQYTKTGIEKFYQFILDTRIEYLPELTYAEKCKWSPFERKCERINKMQNEHELAYQLSRLKFYLFNYCTNIEELVIVLDNIQKIYTNPDKQKEFVGVFLDVFECIENGGIKGTVPWKTYVTVSVRPYNYRIIKMQNKMESYTDFIIWNENKLNSAELFDRVVKKDAADTVREKIIDVESEMIFSSSNNFGDLLFFLSRKFGCKYATMIEKLCFYNMDLMMQAYKRILLNHTWVRGLGFAFTSEAIDANGLAFNNITCIRALACGNDRIYRRWENLSNMEEIDKLIPNILYNGKDENEDYRIINLYTMKYYLRHFNLKMEWGESYIVLKDYVNTFCSLLGIDTKTCIFSIDYLFQRGVLRKSVHDVEEFSGVSYNKYLGTNSKLYITSRGTKLWDMFRDDSVLLELCREDMYLIDDIDADAKKSSYDLMKERKQAKLFLLLIDIIRDIFKQELFYYSKACQNGKRDKYRETFGKQPISLILLEGVTRSIQYSGYYTILKVGNELEANIIAKWKEWTD